MYTSLPKCVEEVEPHMDFLDKTATVYTNFQTIVYSDIYVHGVQMHKQI